MKSRQFNFRLSDAELQELERRAIAASVERGRLTSVAQVVRIALFGAAEGLREEKKTTGTEKKR